MLFRIKVGQTFTDDKIVVDRTNVFAGPVVDRPRKRD